LQFMTPAFWMIGYTRKESIHFVRVEYPLQIYLDTSATMVFSDWNAQNSWFVKWNILCHKLTIFANLKDAIEGKCTKLRNCNKLAIYTQFNSGFQRLRPLLETEGSFAIECCVLSHKIWFGLYMPLGVEKFDESLIILLPSPLISTFHTNIIFTIT
jgi:hypothetical protein